MKALTWHSKGDIRCDTVPDPKIEDPKDVIIKVTSTCICGSDLHLYDMYLPAMKPGDILGHEPMGEVVAVGKEVKKFKTGDRIVVPFDIACGECWFCGQDEPWLCERSSEAAARPYATVEGQDVYPGLSTGGFAEQTVVSERAVLPVPDAVFIGGGLTAPGLLDACWDVLPPGGRLVANTVTLESEALLAEWYRRLGGDLVRLAVAHAVPVGGFTGWRQAMPVTQWSVQKTSHAPGDDR